MDLFRPLLLAALCAVAMLPADAQRVESPIARLESARTRNPQNVAALRALGIAYYKVKRFTDARPVLDEARRLDPRDGVSALYAGLTAEALGDLTNARAAYNSYLEHGRTKRVKEDIRARLVALARREAREAVRAAVANEARLSSTPGSPHTVAVPPLTFSGADSSLKPLERGMADLLITDLSKSARLTVVERDRMQALSDEIRLTQSGRVDSLTAVRAGRLIQAGTLVNGVILQQGGGRLTLDAQLVTVGTGAVGAPATVSNSLDALFAMEKQLVFQLFTRLGIELTPAERQLVERRPTSNLDAFLAYSRGLMAADDGRFEDALRYFDNARSLDPGFGAAAASFQMAQAASLGAQVSAATIETSLGNGSEGQTVQAAAVGNAVPVSGMAMTLASVTQAVNPPSVIAVATSPAVPITSAPQRDAASATTGIDAPNLTGKLVIVLWRP